MDDFGWTYSLGIYDTCGQPELITVGLPFETAKFAMNQAARRLRDGVDLTKKRQAGLIGKVESEVRFVATQWVGRLMNFANWYNGNAEYPVLQLVYPDLQNRFQWEEGFEQRFIQPLLQDGEHRGPTELQFWDSIRIDSERFPGWKFADKPHTKVFVSTAIREGKEWVTYVTHDESDGAWQILGESGSEGGGPDLMCFHHVIERDPTLEDLADLPKGWYAERIAPGEPWERFELEAEEPAE